MKNICANLLFTVTTVTYLIVFWLVCSYAVDQIGSISQFGDKLLQGTILMTSFLIVIIPLYSLVLLIDELLCHHNDDAWIKASLFIGVTCCSGSIAYLLVVMKTQLGLNVSDLHGSLMDLDFKSIVEFSMLGIWPLLSIGFYWIISAIMVLIASLLLVPVTFVGWQFITGLTGHKHKSIGV